ncbi:hypothetical protein AX14_001521 [Amanita brunnescens Koide BX004]|nr:hypothetical protein AX14_001521 [Amanita brunnescens Koide BX004]
MECRFRILIVGRSGTGKSSLINAIFKTSLAEVQHDQAGKADINKEITSEHNKYLILHDSEGYEPGNDEKFRTLETFITEQSQKEQVSERLHAIWLCIPVPYSNGRIFETGDERIFQLNRNKVPIVVVFTKLDLFLARLSRRGEAKVKSNTNSLEVAETIFKEKYGRVFDKSTKNIEGHIPYALVTTISHPETLQRLVKITMQSIDVESPATGLARIRNRLFNRSEHDQSPGAGEDLLDSTQIALATAQRVDMAGKIAASVKVGRKKYWSAIASGMHLFGSSLQKCLYAIHKDIITVWNIRDLDEFLLSETFCRRMMVFVEDLNDQNQRNNSTLHSKITMTSPMAGLTKWTNSVYKAGPEHTRCLMGYVVDLTLIIQAVFQVSLQDRREGKVTQDQVNAIIYEFHCSEKKIRIHDAIWEFVGTKHLFAKESVIEKIESLLQDNEITIDDTQFDQTRSALPSLLAILRFELTADGLIVNQTILELVGKLLDLPDYSNIVSEAKDPSDVALLLDFILYLLRNNCLSDSGIQNANRKARRLMFKLISKTNVLPKSLFITDAKILETIGIGGFGRVLKGEHEGQEVAMKVLYQVQDTQRTDFCREALAWRSLTHEFILPLLGIFEDHAQLYLVSPYMTNGTLTDWRRQTKEPVGEVHRLMLEVAQGVQYIHSEGIVHGDLKGENVLLDSSFHCQIADFGLTRHSDATVTGTSAFSVYFAAPELFGKCTCLRPDCEGCDGDHEMQRKRTMATDVFAFSCLYYAIFFDAVPFQKKNVFQISRLVTDGKHPDRLDCPIMEDDTWNLIKSSREPSPSDRPKMDEIVGKITSFIATTSTTSTSPACT